jgi:YegS/Rv2252/BmrU family lipid kinase
MHYKARLIYNPTAGSFPSGVLGEQVKSALAEYGWELEIFSSSNGSHVTELAAEAARQKLDAVFVAGGDGTIHLALEGLVGTETALGVLPGGTGNVLAQELGLADLQILRANRLVQAARQLAEGVVIKSDVGLCNGKPFLLWAGIGLDGFVVHRIEPRQPWEKQFSILTYASKAMWNIHFWNGVKLKIETPEQEIEGDYLMAVASNIRLYVGGLAELSPSAMLDDGKMDLWLFEGQSPVDAYHRALDLFSRRHLQSEHMICIPFTQAKVSSATPIYTQLDAEPYEKFETIQLEVSQRALNLMIPQKVITTRFTHPPVFDWDNSGKATTEKGTSPDETIEFHT